MAKNSVISQLDEWVNDHLSALPTIKSKFEKDLQTIYRSSSRLFSTNEYDEGSELSFDQFCVNIINVQLKTSEFSQKDLAFKFRFLANKFDLNHRNDPRSIKAWKTQITRAKKGVSTGTPVIDVIFYSHLVKQAPYLLEELPPPEPKIITTIMAAIIGFLILVLAYLIVNTFTMQSSISDLKGDVVTLKQDSTDLQHYNDKIIIEADKLEKHKSGILFYYLRAMRTEIAGIFGLPSTEIVTVNIWQRKGNNSEIYEVGCSDEKFSSADTDPMSKLNYFSLDSTSVVGCHFNKEVNAQGHAGFIVHRHDIDSTYFYTIAGGYLSTRHGIWGRGINTTSTKDKLYTICYRSNVSSDQYAMCVNIAKSQYPDQLSVNKIARLMTKRFSKTLKPSTLDDIMNNTDFTKFRLPPSEI